MSSAAPIVPTVPIVLSGAADDWAWYSEGNIARFWKSGTGDLLGITSAGNVGIGTTAPGNYRLKLNHGNYGLNLEQASTGNEWEIYTAPSNTLSLFYNGVMKGSFSTTGAYTQASDARLKTNIQPMPTVLDKVNQLKPTTYQFKLNSSQAVNSTQEYGFIAQEVLKVFPHLVQHNVDNTRQLDVYTVDYSGFGVLAIKGLQEMQKTIADQQQKISSLENRLASIEAALNTNSNVKSSIKDLSGIVLEQNQPNPFTQNTLFRYQIPAGAQAQIMIYEISSGNLVKTMPAPANGQVQLNGNDLKAGTYVYTLMVNGRLAASKVMALSK